MSVADLALPRAWPLSHDLPRHEPLDEPVLCVPHADALDCRRHQELLRSARSWAREVRSRDVCSCCCCCYCCLLAFARMREQWQQLTCLSTMSLRMYSAVCLCVFVERAKKCLDFGVTLYFIDLLIQCFYSVRPSLRRSIALMWQWPPFSLECSLACDTWCEGVSQDVGLVDRPRRRDGCDSAPGRVPLLAPGT